MFKVSSKCEDNSVQDPNLIPPDVEDGTMDRWRCENTSGNINYILKVEILIIDD